MSSAALCLAGLGHRFWPLPVCPHPPAIREVQPGFLHEDFGGPHNRLPPSQTASEKVCLYPPPPGSWELGVSWIPSWSAGSMYIVSGLSERKTQAWEAIGGHSQAAEIWPSQVCSSDPVWL